MFAFPHGFTVDRQGNVWASDANARETVLGRSAKSASGATMGHQVFKMSPTGRVLMTLGKQGVAGNAPDLFDQPSGIAIAPNGDIFVTDGHGKNDRVVKFSKDGRFIKSWGKPGDKPGEFNQPHCIAIDSRGRVFIGDRSNSRIQIFDQGGNFIDQWKQFGRPSGIFIAADDTLYVTDSQTNAQTNPGRKRGIFIGSAKDGIMIVNHEAIGEGGPQGFAGGLAIYDVAQPSAPKFITKWQTDGAGVHRYDFDGRYAYVSATVKGFVGNIPVILDLADPARPAEVSRWWIPGQWKAGGEAYPWDDFVPPRFGLNELRVGGDVIQDPLSVLGQAKEVVLLLDPMRLACRMQRTASVDEVFFLLEGLTANAIPALVDPLVDVAFRMDARRQLTHTRLVACLGRSDEVVESDVELPPRIAKQHLHLIAVGDGIQTLLDGRAVYVLGMLVVPHQEPRVHAAQLLVTRDDVGRDLLVRRPKVRLAVDVIDRGCQVEAAHDRPLSNAFTAIV